MQWPVTGSPSSFDGIISGGTAQFQSSHGSFHAAALPNGDIELTVELNSNS